MKELVRYCVSLLFVFALLVVLAWLSGFTLDGIVYGHWPEIDDHPRNWDDTASDPNAQRPKVMIWDRTAKRLFSQSIDAP